ncbi:MAG: hypothetical protein A2Z02_04305 [Chloroflexi bacterium RBG_16_48_7]|nr:MAG: hypothetical protein A2Z02_04305 [Chloroflexi bacterium RBG_16_48_7]
MVKNQFIQEDLFKVTTNGVVLVGNKCTNCGYISFPKADFCVQCLGEKMEEVELSKRGNLYSYTITRVPVGKFPVPHAIGIVDLPEKVRITAPLIMSKDNFKIGSEMEMEICTLWTEADKNIIGYKFKAI